jgi:hypothetical protein
MPAHRFSVADQLRMVTVRNCLVSGPIFGRDPEQHGYMLHFCDLRVRIVERNFEESVTLAGFHSIFVAA